MKFGLYMHYWKTILKGWLDDNATGDITNWNNGFIMFLRSLDIMSSKLNVFWRCPTSMSWGKVTEFTISRWAWWTNMSSSARDAMHTWCSPFSWSTLDTFTRWSSWTWKNKLESKLTLWLTILRDNIIEFEEFQALIGDLTVTKAVFLDKEWRHIFLPWSNPLFTQVTLQIQIHILIYTLFILIRKRF